MALWSARLFSSRYAMIDFLNGALMGSVNIHSGALVDGLTFIVDTGSGNITVTFEPAKSRAWTAEEICTEINGADASLTGVASPHSIQEPRPQLEQERRLQLVRDGSLTVRSTGTANEVLGFSDTADTVSVPVADTDIHNITRIPMEQDSWAVVWYA